MLQTHTSTTPTAQRHTRADTIHPETRMGPVTLQVADLARSLRFYTEIIGLHPITTTAASATLGVDQTVLLVLQAHPGARPVPNRATGLFHFALLLPSQAALGRTLQRLIEAGIEIGQGDHVVSEALYLADPDGNGIELYRDRPRDTWTWEQGRIVMGTYAVDIQGLLLAAQREGLPWAGLPSGTTMGHVHLKVSDLAQAQAFFHDLLGFDIVASMPSAMFVSAGGYHHHLGLNTWHSRGAKPAPAGSAGLLSYTILLPDAAEQARLADRLTAAGVAFTQENTPGNTQLVLRDPWDHQLVLAVAPHQEPDATQRK